MEIAEIIDGFLEVVSVSVVGACVSIFLATSIYHAWSAAKGAILRLQELAAFRQAG